MSRDRCPSADIVERASTELRRTYEAAVAALGRHAGTGSGRAAFSRPAASSAKASGPSESLRIVCTTAATATIRDGIDGRRHFVIHGPLKDLDGGELGTFRGVFQAKVFSQSDLLDHPEPPPEPFDRPYGASEPEWTPLLNPAKSEWSFDRVGHVIRGSGLGLSRIVLHQEGRTTFWFSVNSFVSFRDGPVDMALGQATSLATAAFPATPALLDGMSFETDIVHSLSLVPVG